MPYVKDRIEDFPGRIVDVINPAHLQWGLYALAALTGLLLIIESLCHGIVGTNPIEGACRHFITLTFIEQATTFSFSLTAFLLVGVVVVSSFIVTETRRLDFNVNEFELRLGDDDSGDNNGPQITITEYENFDSGEKASSDSGLATWYIDRNIIHPINGYEIVQLSEEIDNIGLRGSRYAVRDVEGGETDLDLEENYDYRIKGRVNYSENILDNHYYRDTENEQRRIHWLLREEELGLEPIERQLRRAVAYSISASVLGVLIQGYPWVAEAASDPWLLDLSFPETAVYILASYLFTFIFIGMISTSVGLLDMMAGLLNR